MADGNFGTSDFESELSASGTTVRLMRMHTAQPTDRVFRRDTRYWLDLCISPRPEQARGCYHERWGPHRFERLGEIFLVPPGEALHVRTEVGEDQLSVVCEIEAASVDRWLERPIEWTDRRLAAGLDIAQPYMRSCLFRLAQEVRRPGTGGVALCEAIAAQLAIELARYVEAVGEGPITGGLASWRLRLIDERLAQLGPPPTLEALAALCAVSVRQLTRGFRTSRGCSIGDHVTQTRVEAARRLLATPDSIKTIATTLGFGSPSNFSYAFRRATGATPREFRQRQLRRRSHAP